MQRLLRDIIPHIYSGDETEMYLHAVQMYRMSECLITTHSCSSDIRRSSSWSWSWPPGSSWGPWWYWWWYSEWYRTLSTEQVIADLRHCDNDPACRWGDRGDVSKVTFLVIAKLIREQNHSHGLLIHSGASWSVTQAARYLFWCREFAREVRRNKKMYNNTIILTRGDKSHVTRVH